MIPFRMGIIASAIRKAMSQALVTQTETVFASLNLYEKVAITITCLL